MKLTTIFILLSILFITSPFHAQLNDIRVVNDEKGSRITVNDKNFMIHGMNWDYFPIGTTYNYSLWDQSENIIKQALESEMSLLKDMGVNTIRIYTGIPQEWITYIYDNYGIYTILNHSFGRYGLTIEGKWIPNTDYRDLRVQDILINEIEVLATEYKNTRGLLLYLLGNENNYGLFWEGAATENIPTDNNASIEKARALYQLFNLAAIAIHQIDDNHPVAMCNGDLQFLDLIVSECPDVDIFGTNIYRGKSFGNTFRKIRETYKKPVLLTEFGSDALNAITLEEDQLAQAFYLKENWKEIFEHAAGLGKANNSIGGCTFQWSDGWWKHDQQKDLKVHNTVASWSNGGYEFDYIEGNNNMNEEWFGICAKGQSDSSGLYLLHPRASYFTLKQVHQLDIYQESISLQDIDAHFLKIKTTLADD